MGFLKNSEGPQSLWGPKNNFKKLCLLHITLVFYIGRYCTVQLFIFWPENMVMVYYSHIYSVVEPEPAGAGAEAR